MGWRSTTMNREKGGGLVNFGNSCYMNSIIQCLYSIVPFLYYFLNINRLYLNDIAKEMAAVLTELYGENSLASLINLKRKLGANYSNFEEQDSHEFLIHLFDLLHDEQKSVPSIIHNLFQGEHKIVIYCQKCHYISSFLEKFTCLSLPIPQSNTRLTLDNLLKKFYSIESIEFDCPRCKRNEKIVKQTFIYRLPIVLIIHFVRFEFKHKKINKRCDFIEFPLANLRLDELYGQYKVYNLCSVSNHFGDISSGHYTSFCKRMTTWHKVDDDRLIELPETEIKTPEAYILFYKSY